MDKHPSNTTDVDTALKNAGFGKFHILIVITGGLMMYTANSESWSIGYAISSAECEMGLDLHEKTLLLSIGSLGMISTQFFWGYLSDKIGRRIVLIQTLLLGCICNIFSILVTPFWLIATFRFMNGAFIAGASGLSIAYVSEFFSSRHRSIAILIMSIFIGLALIMIPLWAWLIIPEKVSWTFLGKHLDAWRIYMLVSGLPALLACFTLYFCPESPKYLVQAQCYQEALEVLKQIHKINNNQTEFTTEKLSNDEVGNKDVQIWKLFSFKYVWKTFVLCILQGGVFATSCGLFLWYPDIIKHISVSKEDVTVCQALDFGKTDTETDCDSVDDSVYVQNILVGVAYTVGYVVISALVNKIGIRNILVSFLGVAGLATFSLHVVVNQDIINILFILLLTLSGVCAVVVNAAVVDLYPTKMRGMAICMVMLSGRIGSILASFLVGYLLIWNCQVTFILFGVSLIGCSILSVALTLYLPNKNCWE